MAERRFPPPWAVEDIDACFVVTDSGQAATGQLRLRPLRQHGEIALKWITGREALKGPREYRAAVGDGEYVIAGPMLRTASALQTIEEFFIVNFGAQQVGEALTLKEAKAMAQHHYDDRCEAAGD